MESGILLIDKPEGPTSTQVVGRVKRLLGVKKIGHLGTLDPFASGLLPLAVNDATKIAQLILTASKSYAGIIALGTETDTEDATGTVVEVRDVPPITDSEIEKLGRTFTGVLQQTPPMFSAIKQKGVRLYSLARQGQTVPRTAREVTIERLSLKKLAAAELAFEVHCSKGTYVRTLAAEIGRFLGCGAHLKTLRRLSCGHLHLEEAVTFEQLERLNQQAAVPLLSLNQALKDLRQICLDRLSVAEIKMGRQEVLAQIGESTRADEMVRLIDIDGALIAIAQWTESETVGRWRLFRVLGSSS